ncbi:tRNA (adenosine(37)-N6)-threonylcarbamoyltransferase complex ATPase subunit type 1 TsaE [Deinococcus sonorensis]|uniref:tRNA threonylcarbamoyladenosine biosynthesis protein TsaE n=2 Tax=Deinococcus sonorensis TaxID=309891 RepID=A0AAU7UFE2_9DEIO
MDRTTTQLLADLDLPTPGRTLLLPGVEAQQWLGARLAELPPGTLLFLEGELGSGKTTLTQGLVRALGFSGLVSSPTYALMHRYPAVQGAVLHIDAYRVRHPQELYEMDLEVLVQQARLSVMEWGQLYYPDFPDAPILRLQHQDDPDVRLLERVR